MYDNEDFYNLEDNNLQKDPQQVIAREELKKLFNENKQSVFFSRQLEVRMEDRYFHWITNRAIRDLIESGLIKTEKQNLKNEGNINILCHKSLRYYRREARKLTKLVEEYANPNISAAIGLHGEIMVLEGFARFQFVMKGRNTNKYNQKEWTETEHDLDFIFERDEKVYGIEVKNMLGYMDYKEFRIKIKLCKYLGIRPVFVVRMIPKTWIDELRLAGGFALILKYQLYPWTHKDLAKKIALELKIPVDSPKAIEDGTMQRFIKWHEKNM